MELIGRVVVHELYNVLKQDENFDRKRFVAALRQLSKLPYDKDDESSYVATDINLPDVRQKLENPAGEIVGIEIKPSSTVKNGDFKGFKYLSELLGDRFLRGIVLYTGDQPVPFGSDLYALPVSTLWQTSEVPHEM